MKKTLFALFLLSSISAFSQFKITGYFNSEVGLNYQLSNKIQIELRINDNIGTEFNSELSLLYKIVSKEDYSLNLGIGASTFPFHSKKIDFLESFYIPLQIEITPIKNFRNFGFVLESAYHFSETSNKSGIRNSVGLRYIFK